MSAVDKTVPYLHQVNEYNLIHEYVLHYNSLYSVYLSMCMNIYEHAKYLPKIYYTIINASSPVQCSIITNGFLLFGIADEVKNN